MFYTCNRQQPLEQKMEILNSEKSDVELDIFYLCRNDYDRGDVEEGVRVRGDAK